MPRIKSTETQCCEKLSIDHALGRHIVVAFVSANGSSRLRPQDPIDRSVIVASTGKPALYFHNSVSAVISVILVTVVINRTGSSTHNRDTDRRLENRTRRRR